jgi:hypothetical protein
MSDALNAFGLFAHCEDHFLLDKLPVLLIFVERGATKTV